MDAEELRHHAFDALHRVADAASTAAHEWEEAGRERRAPHLLVGARVFLDSPGTWCCMFGDCLADAPAGFGDTPYAACADFDRRWVWSKAQIDKYEAEKAAKAKGGGA